MADDKNLKTWVSDYSQLHLFSLFLDWLKGSSPFTCCCGKACGLPSLAKTRAFAHELFVKVPRKSAGLSDNLKEEKEAAMLAKKQKTYQMLDADDDDDNDGDGYQRYQEKKGDSRKRHFRKKEENLNDEDNEESLPVENKKRVRRHVLDDENEDDSESEEARVRDQEEREQLERNMRERDTAATRKLTEPKLSRKEKEAIQRSNAMEHKYRQTLRKVSRQDFLKKRKQKKMEEIRDDIEDEQYLFDGVKLTEAEYRELSIACHVLDCMCTLEGSQDQ